MRSQNRMVEHKKIVWFNGARRASSGCFMDWCRDSRLEFGYAQKDISSEGSSFCCTTLAYRTQHACQSIVEGGCIAISILVVAEQGTSNIDLKMNIFTMVLHLWGMLKKTYSARSSWLTTCTKRKRICLRAKFFIADGVVEGLHKEWRKCQIIVSTSPSVKPARFLIYIGCLAIKSTLELMLNEHSILASFAWSGENLAFPTKLSNLKGASSLIRNSSKSWSSANGSNEDISLTARLCRYEVTLNSVTPATT